MNSDFFKSITARLIPQLIEGGIEQRQRLMQSVKMPALKVSMYCEPNHKLPHVHVYFAKEYEASINLDGEILAGNIKNRHMKEVAKLIRNNRPELFEAWNQIQSGEKSSVLFDTAT